MTYTFRPIDTWPQTATHPRERKLRPFRSTYAESLSLLEYELTRLNAKEAVIQIAVDGDDLRRDGMPRSDAKPRHPGVIISFESKFGPLQYACDNCAAWQDNIHAIALTLERLRLADLYGVAKRGEQYKGWTALPGPRPAQPMTREQVKREQASRTIIELSSLDVTSPETFFLKQGREDEQRAALRAAIRRAHPDSGGSHEEFLRLQKAREVLGI